MGEEAIHNPRPGQCRLRRQTSSRPLGLCSFVNNHSFPCGASRLVSGIPGMVKANHRHQRHEAMCCRFRHLLIPLHFAQLLPLSFPMQVPASCESVCPRPKASAINTSRPLESVGMVLLGLEGSQAFGRG